MIEEVLRQEADLSFKEFNHEDGLNIAMMIVERVKKQQLKSVGIRVVFNQLLVFQYLMDGKKEDIWLKRKEQTVLDSGHNTFYVYLQNQESGKYQQWLQDESYAVCGGGFPLKVNGEVAGSVCVSGLPHEQDHQLIVNTIKDYMKRGTVK